MPSAETSISIASTHCWLNSAYASIPVDAITSFLSRRWTRMTSGPSSSSWPATRCEDRAVVDDELQVEVGDAHAGIAIARRRLAYVAAAPSEAEVAALDGVEEQRPIHFLRDRERERVALELGEPEAGSQRTDDRAHEIREDVLCVIELDAAR